jgi:hypothetical protein
MGSNPFGDTLLYDIAMSLFKRHKQEEAVLNSLVEQGFIHPDSSPEVRELARKAIQSSEGEMPGSIVGNGPIGDSLMPDLTSSTEGRRILKEMDDFVAQGLCNR